MDIALTREERKELSELLDLAPHCFGNIPMMKFCYRKACLRLHPDKGGDAGKMQRLNELWQTFQQSIDCLRNGENAGFYSFQLPNRRLCIWRFPVFPVLLKKIPGASRARPLLLRDPGFVSRISKIHRIQHHHCLLVSGLYLPSPWKEICNAFRGRF
ncbi:156 T antigen [Sus scrofa polyomavirus 1]|uniref:156 T antigen n=1 Tax=Sus scrofa polyomavirus 1 TaxID=1680894 RepID=A0A162GNB6_9POLY|nr:156 T antigen [Sus scrofa polyomavirus 1]AKQ44361.1 156 T antigen [Sus scrofa polyomavirus 1]